MTTVPAGACDCCTSCSGELKVEDNSSVLQSFHRLAWCLLDISPLWEEPNQRGANVVLPGVAGRAENPRRPDETDYALRFAVSGVVDTSGNPVTDENKQLRLNLAYIRANMLNPVAPLTSRAAQLISPDGMTTLTGNVQFGQQPLVRGYRESGVWIGTLHLVVPAGSFA